MAFALMVIFLTVIGASAKDVSDSTRIVASVGNEEITYQDFSGRYEDYLIYAGVQDNIQARYAILNNMINEILLRRYDDNSKVYGNPEYKKELASAWNRTVLAFLKDQEVYAKITVSDGELREAYRRSKIKLSVRHLYAKTEKDAQNIYELVKMGISFDELAKQVFTDTTLRNNGGSLGYITWGATDPNFENAAYSLKVGEVSRPVKTAEGYSIIRVDDRVEDPFTTEYGYLNMKRKLERAIRIDKKLPSEAAYLQKVFDKSKLKFNEKAIEAVLADLNKAKGEKIELSTRTPKVFKDCVEYGGRKYDQKEIETKLLEQPSYDRKFLESKKELKLAVTGLVMQDVLLSLAKNKGYDTTSYVSEMYTKVANEVYLNYKRNEVLDVVPVSDSEVTRYYSDNVSYFTGERQLNVQEIILDNDSTALVVKAKIEGGLDFGVLAAKISLRKWSARNNGIMGLSPISSFGELKDTLWSLPEGKVLGPVKFDKYYGIFRVVGREEGRPIDVALVRDRIVKAIENEKGFPYMKKKLESLSKETSIKVNDEIIRKFTINLAGK